MARHRLRAAGFKSPYPQKLLPRNAKTGSRVKWLCCMLIFFFHTEPGASGSVVREIATASCAVMTIEQQINAFRANYVTSESAYRDVVGRGYTVETHNIVVA